MRDHIRKILREQGFEHLYRHRMQLFAKELIEKGHVKMYRNFVQKHFPMIEDLYFTVHEHQPQMIFFTAIVDESVDMMKIGHLETELKVKARAFGLNMKVSLFPSESSMLKDNYLQIKSQVEAGSRPSVMKLDLDGPAPIQEQEEKVKDPSTLVGKVLDIGMEGIYDDMKMDYKWDNLKVQVVGVSKPSYYNVFKIKVLSGTYRPGRLHFGYGPPNRNLKYEYDYVKKIIRWYLRKNGYGLSLEVEFDLTDLKSKISKLKKSMIGKSIVAEGYRYTILTVSVGKHGNVVVYMGYEKVEAVKGRMHSMDQNRFVKSFLRYINYDGEVVVREKKMD